MNVDQTIAMIPEKLRPITSVHGIHGYTEVAITIEGWGVIEFNCHDDRRVYAYATFESSEPLRMRKAMSMMIDVAVRAKEYDDTLWQDTHYSENL